MYSCIPGNTPTGGGTRLGCVDEVLAVDIVLADVVLGVDGAPTPLGDTGIVHHIEVFLHPRQHTHR